MSDSTIYKHYIIYKTTNLINSKIYIGQHSTNNLDDGYLGSGKKLKLAIKKHRIYNFTKEILFSYDTFEEMDCKERELVNEDFVRRNDTYNIICGGSNTGNRSLLSVEKEEIRRAKISAHYHSLSPKEKEMHAMLSRNAMTERTTRQKEEIAIKTKNTKTKNPNIEVERVRKISLFQQNMNAEAKLAKSKLAKDLFANMSDEEKVNKIERQKASVAKQTQKQKYNINKKRGVAIKKAYTLMSKDDKKRRSEKNISQM